MDESVQKHLQPMSDAVTRALLRAADEIERRGWCQHVGTFQGAVCMEGGLLCALGKDPSEFFPTGLGTDAFDRLCQSLKRDGFRAPHEWNDMPGRTKEEVVAKLRAVALGG